MDNYYFHMDNLSVGYNRKALIHDICIGIKKGEIVTLIGPNGSIGLSVHSNFPPHIIKCFLLKIQGFPTFLISVNKPQL